MTTENDNQRGNPSRSIHGLVSENISIDGYPPLPVILAHFDATKHLIKEVRKGKGSFRNWDRHRNTTERHKTRAVAISR